MSRLFWRARKSTAALATTTPPGAAFWLALLLVIWDTAERINAVMGLTWDRVDLRNGWIRFDAEDRKGATADTAARIAPDTIAALKAIKRREGLVFRWPYSRTYLFQHLGRIMQRAGLPNGRHSDSQSQSGHAGRRWVVVQFRK